MTKVRVNITLDKSVKEDLDRRNDINISGAANDFFKRLLAGEDQKEIAKQIKIERLQNLEEEHQQKAQNYRAEWQELEQHEQEKEQEEQDKWEQALDMLMVEEFMGDAMVKSEDTACKDFADDLDMSLDAFKDELKERWEAQ